MIDINVGSGEIDMRTMAENEMPNPWKEVECTVTKKHSDGKRGIISIEFDHVNGIGYAKMCVVENRLIVEGMDHLLKQDFDDLWKIIIQSLTAKQVPI